MKGAFPMIDLSTTNCRQMQERYYAALLDWEKLRYLNRERKAKTAEELEKLKEKKLEIYHKEEQKAEEALVEEFVSFSRIAAK